VRKRRPALGPVLHCLAAGLLVTPSLVAGGTPPPQAPPPVGNTARDAQMAMSPKPLVPCLPARWVQELWPAPESVSFRPTTLEERLTFARLVPELLHASTRTRTVPPALVALAGTVGFELLTWKQGDDVLWVLREQPARRRGAGAYVLRTGTATQDVIQAPHAYFDVGTGPLALTLFACAPEGHRPRAFMTNTAHRYRARPGERRADADHPADVAHNPDHLFQHVTDAFARELPALRVFQVHGFGKEELDERQGLAAVVSPGSRARSPWVRQVALRLGPLLGTGVRVYPDETQLLGGTQNAQARLLQAYPRARFIHLELSASSRRALTSQEQVACMATALLAPVED
jgi:hypothetical protein